MSPPVRVLLVDDHTAVRVGIRMVIEVAPGFEVVGEAGDGATAVSMARALQPDVVLMDLRMPVMDGVQATERIVAEELGRVIALTTFDHDSYLFGVLAAGASGFLLKTAEPAEITSALHRVHEGGTVIAPEVAGRLVSAAVARGGGHGSGHGSSAAAAAFPAASPGAAAGPPARWQTAQPGEDSRAVPAGPPEELTAREAEVLQCLADGLSNARIARLLGISEATVKTHVSRVLAKLGVQSRLQAALLARTPGPGPGPGRGPGPGSGTGQSAAPGQHFGAGHPDARQSPAPGQHFGAGHPDAQQGPISGTGPAAGWW